MQKKLLLLLSVLGLFFVRQTALANDIEPGKEFYTATRVTNTMEINGSLSEWMGVPVLADPKFLIPKSTRRAPGDPGTLVLFELCDVCVAPLRPDWTGPDDQTSAVQVVWDVDNVYLGFVVTDEYHENAANSAWNGDSVQLMIADAARAVEVALYNYALGGVEDALGEVIVEHQRPVPPPGVTEAVVTRNGTTKRTTYEIKMPAAAVGLTAPLQAGMQFGLGMAINDGDQAVPGQGGWGGLGAHSIVFGKTPSETALITLGTNLPTTDRIFFSAINPTINTFSFRATDKGASIVDTNSAKLIIDGQTVALIASPKTVDATDFTYTRASPFPPNSDHTYTIEVKDTLGTAVTSSSTFRTPTYALLKAADKVTPDTSKPGFIWRVHQNDSLRATDNNRPLQQLAGLLGQNFADRNAQGVALAPGTPGANNRLPIEFEIASAINLNQDASGAGNGDIVPDDQMPGIPGTSGDGLDGIAAEITAYLDLPVGKHTLIVNSDDGFRTTAGNINDIFRAQVAGEFPAGRGAADTAYIVFVQDAGVYALRTVWEEGGSDASIEWKLKKADDTEVLLNDVANGGFAAYRRTTTLFPTAISLVSPAPGATDVRLDTAISAVLLEGTNVVDLNSVKLIVGGAQVTAPPAKVGNLITVNYQPLAFFPSASQQSASITYTAGGVSRTESWTFTVETYPTLTRAHRAVSVDKTKPGFLWRVFQNEAVTPTSVASTEQALAGQLMSGGQLLPNLADPAAVGIASGAGTRDGPLVKFEIPTVINLSQTGGENNGNFTMDDQMPGIPGTSGANDGIDAEILTFVDFPAGLVIMGVNSDDGFRTQAGYINKPADGLFLGQFDTGRAAADSIFKFVVQDAGVFGLRTIWQEGGGGANIEWFTVKADGTKVLLNDSANGGLKAYRVGVAPNKSSAFSAAAQVSAGQVVITWTEPGVVLQESTDLTRWSDLPTATSPYRPTIATRTSVFYRLKK